MVAVGLGLEPEEGDELAEEIEMGDATGMRFYAKLQYQPDRCVSVYSPYWVVNEAEFSVKLVLPDSDGQELAGQGIGVLCLEWGAHNFSWILGETGLEIELWMFGNVWGPV